MPKAQKETSSSHRYDPVAGPSNNDRLIRPARDEDIGDLIVQRRPQVVRISSDDGHVITDTEEVFDDDETDASEDGSGDSEDASELDDDDEDDSADLEDAEATEELQSISPPNSDAYLLRVSIMTAGPPRITRILRVPSYLSFHQFHSVIQEAFDWDNGHAYRFDICDGGKMSRVRETLDMPSPLKREGEPLSGSERRRLCDVFGKPGDPMAVTYTFDFGDDWIHTIHLLGPADKHLASGMGINQEVFCAGGEGAPAVGDCGGPYGWEEIKKLFKNPQMPDPYGRKKWCRQVSGRRTIDPYKWDMDEVNKLLKVLGRKRYDVNAARGLV